MPKVDVEIGYTLRIGDPQFNEYIRLRYAIKDLETGDHHKLAKELVDAREAIGSAVDELDGVVMERLKVLGRA